jgi:hypothetical protein
MEALDNQSTTNITGLVTLRDASRAVPQTSDQKTSKRGNRLVA